MTDLISALLRRRARRAGAEPLLTCYEPATGTRVELSAVTLLNWVDKTSHLLDELDVTSGDAVEMPLALSAPGHWMTVVWQLACWQVGAAVVVGTAAVEARLRVCGPDWEPFDLDDGADLVACSLHPLGLPLPQPPPGHVTDYAAEVRGQGDQYGAQVQSPAAVAWVDPERRLTQAALVGVEPSAGRRLVRPASPWETAVATVVAPLLGNGSVVVVAGEVAPHQLSRIYADERVSEGP